MATPVPEVHTFGGDDVVVVARCPAAAGAGSTRQGADRALNYSKEREQVKLCQLSLRQNNFLASPVLLTASHGLHQWIEFAYLIIKMKTVLSYYYFYS